MMQPKHRRDSGEAINTDIITLSRFILEQQHLSAKNATGEFSMLLNSLQFAFKFISQTIRRAELVNLIGLAGASNSTGDQQKKLDVLGDEIFINAMKASGNVKVLVSEEPVSYTHLDVYKRQFLRRHLLNHC